MLLNSIRFVESKGGKALVLLNGKIWVSRRQWELAGGKPSQHLQVGWNLQVEFVKVGETLANGTVCETANSLVRSFSLSPSAAVQDHLGLEFAKAEAAMAFGAPAASTPTPKQQQRDPLRDPLRIEPPHDGIIVTTGDGEAGEDGEE